MKITSVGDNMGLNEKKTYTNTDIYTRIHTRVYLYNYKLPVV